MPERSTADIKLFHAHVYYDAAGKPAAAELRAAIASRFEVVLGRWHDDPVGPHPCGSYQVAFSPGLFGDLVPWLALNRGDLVVFVHPDTGDAIPDHTEHALWLGPQPRLNIDALR